MPWSTSTALVFPSAPRQLPPELKLAQAVSEFAQALDGERKHDFMRLQAQCAGSPPTASDVIKMTEELNREGARRHASWTPAAGTRLGGFLSRLQKFAEAGDVLIGGSQSLIASGVWTTVRVSLEAALGHYAYFDQVSSLLMRLTQKWSITLEFAKHFPDSPELQAFLAEYLARVVQLCQKILVVAKRPPYLLLAASILSSFETEFKPIEDELNHWTDLIKSKFEILANKAAQEQQVAVKDAGRLLRRFHKTWKRQDELEQQQRIFQLLSPRQPQIDAIWRRERKRGTPSWILNAPEYKLWKAGTRSVLRVTGHFGCGKTVALASIISDAIMENKKCAGFICKKDDPNTLEGLTILGSIAHQLLQSSTVRQDWEAMIQRNPSIIVGSMATSSIVQLLQNLLPQNQAFYVVLDGLQECAKQEVEVVLEALHDLRKAHQISVCFSTTLDGLPVELTEEYLGTAAVLSLNNSQRDVEIGHFIRTEVQRRNAARQPPLNSELENLVIEQLALGAQGMYLWVSLHLDALFPSHNDGILTDESVLNILNHLPQDLPRAFDQALGRISDLRYGDRIFQLVTVAESPLTGEQLNVALTVQPGNNIWNETKLPRSTKQVVARCGGGLLEIDEEDNCVRFIHHSVQSHMYGQKAGMDGRNFPLGWLADANSFMGSVCVTYLNFGEFDRRMAPRQVIDPNLVSEKLKKEAACSNPIVASVVRHIKGDKQRKVTPEQLNIFPILLKAQTRDNEPMRCFFPYASRHWAQHTAQLSEEDGTKIDILWKALVYDRPPHISVPWSHSIGEEGGMLEYAFRHLHKHLYRCIINDHLEDVGIITFARRFVVDEISTTICFAEERQLEWLIMMIEKCLIGSSLITTAYCLALLYIYLKAHQSEGRISGTGALQRTIRSHWLATLDELFGARHMSTQESHSAKISAETATSHLWSLIGKAYATLPTAAAPAVIRIAVPAVLKVLASIPPSTETHDSMKESFFACLGVVARTRNSDTFSDLWKYVCKKGIPRYKKDLEPLAPQLLEYACLHTDLDLVRMVTIQQTVELSVFEQILGRVKGEAEPIFRSHIRLLMTPINHLIKRPSMSTLLNTHLGALQGCLMKKEHDQALAVIRETSDSYLDRHLGDFMVQVLSLVIVYRCDTVLQRMPYVRRALEGWPTVLIDTMITFAIEASESNADEEAESERNIFFTLLSEVRKFQSHDLYITGFDDSHKQKSDSGWTALHAAALWQGYAVQALLTMSASTKLTTRQTRSGLTPLVVALCGRLNQKDVHSVVDDLLSAESTISGTKPLKDAHQDLPVSPLDCSIALQPPQITRLLVWHGITYKSGSPTVTDKKIQIYIHIIALLESKRFNWHDWQWGRTAERVTSLEGYYKTVQHITRARPLSNIGL